MKILICGSGKGSWIMRGLQLGAALGARVTSSPTDEDFRWCDLVVLVKKHAISFAPRAHKAGKPIVWDALDFWAQPAHNAYTRDAALLALGHQARVIQPSLIIGATEAMAKDAASIGYQSAYLPHHSWAGLVPTPPKARIGFDKSSYLGHRFIVAYQGNPSYLGRWQKSLANTCEFFRWQFVVNPDNISDADIVVALRDGIWDGWICRNWKSGVKVVNAIAAGRPLISQPTEAMAELLPMATVVESLDDITPALEEAAANTDTFYEIGLERAKNLTLESVAIRYLNILSTVEARCATA